MDLHLRDPANRSRKLSLILRTGQGSGVFSCKITIFVIFCDFRKTEQNRKNVTFLLYACKK